MFLILLSHGICFFTLPLKINKKVYFKKILKDVLVYFKEIIQIVKIICTCAKHKKIIQQSYTNHTEIIEKRIHNQTKKHTHIIQQSSKNQKNTYKNHTKIFQNHTQTYTTHTQIIYKSYKNHSPH